MTAVNRRGFLSGLAAALAMPAIVRTPGVLMALPRWPMWLEHATPQAFGAIGDGIADDTAALQRAFDRSEKVFGSGVFRITRTLTSPRDRHLSIGGFTIFGDQDLRGPLIDAAGILEIQKTVSVGIRNRDSVMDDLLYTARFVPVGFVHPGRYIRSKLT